MNRRLVVVSILVLLVSLSVVLPSLATQKDEIVVANIGQITSIDPSFPNWSSNANTVFYAVYENLIRFTKGSIDTFEPMLATVVPTRDNGLIVDAPNGNVLITFPIRAGVKFQDGQVLTAADVKYSFLRKLTLEGPGGEDAGILAALTGYQSLDDWAKALEPGISGFEDASDSTVAAMFKTLEDSITTSGMSVTFHLTQPTGLFLQWLVYGQPSGVIINKVWTIQHGGWPETADTWRKYYNPQEQDTALYSIANGTGPFMVQDWNITNQVMVLARFDGYWGGPAKIKIVRLKYVPEWSTRKLMLETGDADFAYVPPQFMPQAAAIPGVTVAPPTPSGVIRVLFFQWPISGTRFTGSGKLDGKGIPADFFGDINVRKGFEYAFDWKTFITQVLGGNAFQIQGPLSTMLPGNSPNNPVYHYDPAKATEFFKKAFNGDVWTNGFTFTAIYNSGNTLAQSALELLRADLRKINPKFNFQIQASTWNEFIPLRTSGQTPLFYSGWGLAMGDAYDTLNAYLASDGYFNPYIPGLAALCKQYADPLLHKALTTFDSTARAALYKQLLDFTYNYATHIYLVEDAVQMVYRSNVKGWYFQPAAPGINMPGIDFYSLYKTN